MITSDRIHPYMKSNFNWSHMEQKKPGLALLSESKMKLLLEKRKILLPLLDRLKILTKNSQLSPNSFMTISIEIENILRNNG